MAVLAMLLHLTGGAVGPFVDGSLEAVTDGGVHIEAEGDDACAPIHDHLTCQLCRVLTHGMITAPRVLPAVSPESWTEPMIRRIAPHRGLAAFVPRLGPRAPPLA